MTTPPTRRIEYEYFYGAPIAAGYLIAGDNLPPLPFDPSGAAPYYPYPMPIWMPRQVHIVDAFVGFECTDVENRDLMEIEFWVDPAGKSFFSTDPMGLEANYERDITIMGHAEYPLRRESLVWSGDFTASPILWDRNNGDLLVLKIACSREVPWVAVRFRFLGVNTVAIQPLRPGY